MKFDFIFVEVKELMHVEKVVFMNEPSNTRRSFLHYLHTKPCGVMNKSGKKRSSQHGNTVTCMLRSSLFRVVSALDILLLTEV